MLPTLRSAWTISERRELSWSKSKDIFQFIPLFVIFSNDKDETLEFF